MILFEDIGVLYGWSFDFGSWGHISSFGKTIADCSVKIKKEIETRQRQKSEREGGSSIDYIYKKPDRVLHNTT